MSEIFADTSGWANYFVRTEPFHQAAKQLMQQCHKKKRADPSVKMRIGIGWRAIGFGNGDTMV
jgi:predicted nucleic acid-binding protein